MPRTAKNPGQPDKRQPGSKEAESRKHTVPVTGKKGQEERDEAGVRPLHSRQQRSATDKPR